MGLLGARSVSRDPSNCSRRAAGETCLLQPRAAQCSRERHPCRRAGITCQIAGFCASPRSRSAAICDVSAHSRDATGHAGLGAVCHRRPRRGSDTERFVSAALGQFCATGVRQPRNEGRFGAFGTGTPRILPTRSAPLQGPGRDRRLLSPLVSPLAPRSPHEHPPPPLHYFIFFWVLFPPKSRALQRAALQHRRGSPAAANKVPGATFGPDPPGTPLTGDPHAGLGPGGGCRRRLLLLLPSPLRLAPRRPGRRAPSSLQSRRRRGGGGGAAPGLGPALPLHGGGGPAAPLRWGRGGADHPRGDREAAGEEGPRGGGGGG